MLRELDTRDGLTCYAVTSVDDLDLPALVALMDAAWGADYRDQVRLAFDATFLRWLMVAPSWAGALICTPEGTPVGFDMALERTLYCSGQPLRNELQLGRAGQLQTVHAVDCTPAHLQQALHHFCRWLQDDGCMAVTILAQGVIPLQVLQALNFRPGDDQLIFAVRGPREAIAAFETAPPPYFIDFI